MISIRTGSLLIAYQELLRNIIILITGVFILTKNSMDEFYPNEPELVKLIKQILITISSVVTFLIATNALVIFGIHLNKPNCMIPWLISKLLLTVLSSFSAIVICGFSIVGMILIDPFAHLIVLVIVVLSLVYFWHSFLVVFSYYKTLTDDPQYIRQRV